MAFLVTLVLATGLGFVAPSAASAHGNACGGGPWESIVKDRDRFFNFHEACHGHDSCYDKRPFGFDSVGRKLCDRKFQTDMKSWCDRKWNRWYEKPAKRRCRDTANVYYGVVRDQGSSHFHNGGSLRTGPNSPTGVRTARYSSSSGEVMWNRATDRNGHVVGYRVTRDGRDLGVLDQLSIYEGKIGTGRHIYRIVAIDNDGRGSRPVTVALNI